MNKRRIFISSVQKEFAVERRALHDFIDGDPMLSKFFEVFLIKKDFVFGIDKPVIIRIKSLNTFSNTQKVITLAILFNIKKVGTFSCPYYL